MNFITQGLHFEALKVNTSKGILLQSAGSGIALGFEGPFN